MPAVQSGESRKAYVSRCIAYVIEKEGLKPKHAAGKCHGMYRQHVKKSRSRKARGK